MPWLINEDRALKKKLEGIQVTDANARDGREVPVRFILPEAEVGKMTYPLIVIEHAGLYKADDREHRGGALQLSYVPEGKTGVPGDYWVPEYPIPYDLDYHVTTYTRLAEHNRILSGLLMQVDRIPSRFGYLEVPEDGTIRRLDLIGGPWPTSNLDGEQKRVFRSQYIVRINSELLPAQVETVTNFVDRVVMDLAYYSDTYVVPIQD